jgi:hypothetical protein
VSTSLMVDSMMAAKLGRMLTAQAAGVVVMIGILGSPTHFGEMSIPADLNA